MNRENLPFDPKPAAGLAPDRPADLTPRIFVRFGRACVQVPVCEDVAGAMNARADRGRIQLGELDHEIAVSIASWIGNRLYFSSRGNASGS